MAREHDSVETVLRFDRGFLARLELLAKMRNCKLEDLVMESLDARFGNLSAEERTRAVGEMGRMARPRAPLPTSQAEIPATPAAFEESGEGSPRAKPLAAGVVEPAARSARNPPPPAEIQAVVEPGPFGAAHPSPA